MNYIDIIIILIIGSSVLNSMRKGLMLSLFDLVTFVATLVLTRILSPTVTLILKKTPFYDMIFDTCRAAFGSISSLGILNYSSLESKSAVSNLPQYVADKLVQQINTAVDKISVDVSVVVAGIIISLVATVLTFAVVLLGLKLVARAVNIVTYLPVVHQFNEIGGAAFGFVKGCIIVWLICIVVGFFSANAKYSDFYSKLNSSTLGNWFYNNNYILQIANGGANGD